MSYRIRRIDSRESGNYFIAKIYAEVFTIEKKVYVKRFYFFGRPVPTWVRVDMFLSFPTAQRALDKLKQGPRQYVRAETLLEEDC